MTLAQLEAFYWVVRLGSVQEAARHINVAQPTISFRIRSLEEAIGKKVFQRVGRSLRATHTGEALLVHVRTILDEVSSIRENLGKVERISGIVRLGISEGLAYVCLSALMDHLKAAHPQLQVDLCISTSSELEDEIRNHHLDIAFLVDPLENAALRLVRLGVMETTWAASPKWGLGPVITPADIAHLPILTNPFPSPNYRRIIDWFRTARIAPSKLEICSSVTEIAHLVTGGVALGFLPFKVIEARCAEGLVLALESRPGLKEGDIFAAYRREDSSPAIEAVLLATQSILRDVGMLQAP